MTPQQLVNTILESDEYSEDEKELAQSINSQLQTVGATQKQIKALEFIINENEMYLNGYSPYDDEHNYRIGR